MTQLDKAATIMKLDRSVHEILRQPKRVLTVSIPVRMDDGSMKVFTGFRSQYTDALGPFKGGIRYHWNVTLDEVKALSFWMALKCATVGIPLGGGKGGIIVNPKELSQGELERLTCTLAGLGVRRYALQEFRASGGVGFRPEGAPGAADLDALARRFPQFSLRRA